MEIRDCRITFLVSDDGATIKFNDADAGIEFLEVHLTPSQLCQALGRLSRTHCAKATIRCLDKVGKKMTHKQWEFAIPKVEFRDQKDVAKNVALETCPSGWEPDLYFGSKDSFFTRGGQPWARTTIRQWSESEAEQMLDPLEKEGE